MNTKANRCIHVHMGNTKHEARNSDTPLHNQRQPSNHLNSNTNAMFYRRLPHVCGQKAITTRIHLVACWHIVILGECVRVCSSESIHCAIYARDMAHGLADETMCVCIRLKKHVIVAENIRSNSHHA